MKKVLLSSLGIIAILGVVGYLFRVPLIDVVKEKITEDMFVDVDDDSFDPGLPLGTSFPAINAQYQGRIVSDASEFVADKGMIFVANRSSNW